LEVLEDRFLPSTVGLDPTFGNGGKVLTPLVGYVSVSALWGKIDIITARSRRAERREARRHWRRAYLAIQR
jgi:hypothetical protein